VSLFKDYIYIYMDQDEFFKIIGILIVCFVIIYFVIKMFQLQTSVIEGLTGNTPISSGEAGNAASYAPYIKAEIIKLQDELLISKYRKDYESIIINLDDYIGYLMIKQMVNIRLDSDINVNIESIDILNKLKNAKGSLNDTMTFLDKQ